MSMTDPIADMLTRIRNANVAFHDDVPMPSSKLKEAVAKILERELNEVQVPGYSRFEVLNAGVGNYNTVQEVTHYLIFDRTFNPDLVILQYFINDAERCRPSGNSSWWTAPTWWPTRFRGST